MSAPAVIPGAVNFRDTGGLPAEAGATRRGVLFRSGTLAQLDSAARAAIGGLGLRRVVDLRDDDEVALQPTGLEPPVADTVRVPLVRGSVASFIENDMSLADLYDHILDESAPQLVEVVRSIVGTQPVLVHCTAGKDRTGVAIAVTLAAAGVEEEAIVADYARTAALLPPERGVRIVAWLRRVHPDAVHLEELTTASPAPVMHALLQRVREEHGSARDYLHAAGLGEDETAELGRILVVR